MIQQRESAYIDIKGENFKSSAELFVAWGQQTASQAYGKVIIWVDYELFMCSIIFEVLALYLHVVSPMSEGVISMGID